MKALYHRLNETITVQARDGVSSSGDPSFATATTMRARLERNTRLRQEIGGNEFVLSHEIVTFEEIPMGSLVWLPGADTSSKDESITPAFPANASAFSDGTTIYETSFGVSRGG